MDILHTCILFKVFHNCSLPDVASAIIALLHIISLVVSLWVIVGEDDEPNNVEFVLIVIHCEFTETFQWYCMTKDTLYHIIYIYDMYSYVFIYVSML